MIKTYTIKDIQKVYRQHAYHCGTVLISIDGYNWKSVGMDSGKWFSGLDKSKVLFSFIEESK